MSAKWTIVLVGALGTFVLKAIGYALPESWLAHPKVQRVSALIPVALLSALIVVNTFAVKTHLQVDARLAALLVAMSFLHFGSHARVASSVPKLM